MMFGNFEDFAGIQIFYVSIAFLDMCALSVMLFKWLGQETGRLFQSLKPLTAYSINVAGGLPEFCFFVFEFFLHRPRTYKDFPKLSFFPREASVRSDITPSEDDWPFLFLPRRELPMTYVWPIFLIIFVGFLPLYKEIRKTDDAAIDSLMFCLGMGFMLLEVRSMSELSLLFGSTWLVNSVIIAAVMLFILLSNYIASRLSSKWTPMLTMILLAVLVLSAFVKANSLAVFGPVGGSLLGCLVFLVPLIFSSAIFSLTFKSSKSVNRALALNLVGGLVGVCLEYLSMAFGIKALTYIAIAIYLVVLYLTNKVAGRSAETN